MIKKIVKNQSGQTFVIVFLLMLIALTIGVAVSSRFTRTLRTIVVTDDSTKALYIAEAGLEKLLSLPITTLEDYITFNNCGSDCVVEITDTAGQVLRADVSLSFIGDSEEHYLVNAQQNNMSQVLLEGYGSGQPISVCWNGGLASVYASYVYSDATGYLSDAYAYNPVAYSGTVNDFDPASANHGYANCFDVTVSNTPKFLRIKSFYQDVDVYIVPASGQTIPRQGILIESTGKAGSTVKTARAIKTTSMAPSFFDYVLYQKSETDALSN